MSKRAFTLVMPYYCNPNQFHKQLVHLASLPDDVRDKIHLIVVDDGSPEKHAIDMLLPWGRNGMNLASFQLFRVDVDVRWNWLTCRNIGVHHAPTEWVLMTDIDHMLPEETARRIIEQKLRPNQVYRFSRKDLPALTDYKPHPNSWLMTKAMFEAVGGYDERFSGYYGTDGMFRDRVRTAASRIVMLEECLWRVPRERVADASTTRYARKTQEDHDGLARVRKEIAVNPGPPKNRSFPYHRVI